MGNMYEGNVRKMPTECDKVASRWHRHHPNPLSSTSSSSAFDL